MSKRLLAGIVGLSLLGAACGDDSTNETSPDTQADTQAETASPPTAPAATADAAASVTTSAPDATTDAAPADTTLPDTVTPDAADADLRIASLSPTLTETMFAIGADDLLVAVDSLSDYPDAAFDLPHELSAFEPNVEAIAGYEPDVVLISGDFTGLGDQLEPLGIELWDGPAVATLDEAYAQIEALGARTGRDAGAADVVAGMRADIDEIVGSVPDAPADDPLTYFHELDSELYTATSDSFIGATYSLFGLENIADAAGGDTAYPQLNAEFLIEADPDLIFLADTICCGQSIDTVAERPGWDVLSAVQNGAVIEMDDNVASRWGPRIVDYIRDVADAVSTRLASA